MKRILYNNITGKIESCVKMSDKSLQMTLDNNTQISSMNGICDPDKYKVNVSVDPHILELLPAPSIDVNAEIRTRRNRRLQACDWTQGADSPLTDAKKAEWATYRQALRDITNNYNDGTCSCWRDVNWPSVPE